MREVRSILRGVKREFKSEMEGSSRHKPYVYEIDFGLLCASERAVSLAEMYAGKSVLIPLENPKVIEPYLVIERLGEEFQHYRVLPSGLILHPDVAEAAQWKTMPYDPPETLLFALE